MSGFIIYKQVYPPSSKPYGLIELVKTADGIRSRIVHGRYEIKQEAQSTLRALEMEQLCQKIRGEEM